MKIGDKEVDLYLSGYWKIGIMGGLSVESGPKGIIFPAAFPGLTDFKFYQEPDLTISLWLMNRYYLETSFLEGFDKNTYAMGYRGMEGEPVQSVRIGNSDIYIDEYKGISVPAPQYNTPGISASFQSEISTHDILIRYDPTSEHKKVFLGEYEITEEVIEIGNYNRGQYFILPESDLDFIDVLIADKKGIFSGSDGKKYRKVRENEMFHSLSDGTISFFQASETDVLVYYEKSGNAVGETTVSGFITPLVNGEPDPDGASPEFSWTENDTWHTGTYEQSCSITINSRKYLKVYNPGKFGPFELCNLYSINTPLPPDLWRTEIFLADSSQIKASDYENY
ncbi:MAG: hypothetical protein JEY91_10665, partial [Spirochaetaceae bacterium]|nr:hypothetical protein [Spirochaetaceae bacterium]